jgi:hypothetical protein
MQAMRTDSEPKGRPARAGSTVPTAKEAVEQEAEGSSDSEEEQVLSLQPKLSTAIFDGRVKKEKSGYLRFALFSAPVFGFL